MHIDPNAWLVTLPVTVALVQLYFQPSDFAIKRWWNKLVQWEIETWGRLSLIGWVNCQANPARFTRLIYAASVIAAGACSAASFGSFIGVLQ